MKLVKRFSLFAFLMILVLFLFKGLLFRNCVTYKSIKTKEYFPIKNAKLIEYINENVDEHADTSIVNTIKLALSITSNQLNFTTDKNDSDPNKLITTKEANCVGYASFFATSCNYIFSMNKLSETWHAKSHAGQLYFLGINIHTYFKSSFFKNHDFVTIENKTTGEIFAVDPSVHDYLNIDFVFYSK